MCTISLVFFELYKQRNEFYVLIFRNVYNSKIHLGESNSSPFPKSTLPQNQVELSHWFLSYIYVDSPKVETKKEFKLIENWSGLVGIL